MNLATINERQPQLDAFMAEFFPAPEPTPRVERPAITTYSDDELVSKMLAAKNGDKIRSLLAGDLAGYGSASESDAALAHEVVWWANHDLDAAERIMRSHGPMREKWNTKRGDTTWLRQELERASQRVGAEGYTGAGSGGAIIFDAAGHRNGHVPASTEPVEPGEWEPPVPLMEHVSLPTFPASVLPRWLENQAVGVARHTQTPFDMAAMIGLGTCAACVQKRIELVIDSDYTEPLNIYVLVLMPSGDTKSSVFRAMTEPLVEYEAEMAVLAQPMISDAEAERAFLEKQAERALRDATKEKGIGQDAGLYDYKDAQRRLKALVIPPVPRLLLDDVTPEKLGTIMAEQGGRGALISDEGGIWDTFAGRYNSGVVNIDLLLKAHSAGTVRIDRVGRSEHIPNAALTIVQTAQPNVLQGMAKHPELKERGVIPRLLFCLPKSYVGFRKRKAQDAPPVPTDIRSTYRQMIRALLLTGEACKPEAMKQPAYRLYLSPEAQRLREDFEEWREPQLAPGGELSALGGWAKKIVGQTCRIAGILHLAEHAGDAAPWETLISGETMAKAVDVGKYLIEHAKAAYMEMGVSTAVADARRIIEWVQRTERASITRRDVLAHIKLGGDATDAALRLLLDHGWVRERVRPRVAGKVGAPTKPTYEVNPHPRQQNQHIQQKSAQDQPSGLLLTFVEAEPSGLLLTDFPCADHPDDPGWTPDKGFSWCCRVCRPSPREGSAACLVCGAEPWLDPDYCRAHDPADVPAAATEGGAR